MITVVPCTLYGLQGILRGAGKQTVGAVVSFTGFYLVSLPCAFSLGFAAHLGLHGMWYGMMIGYSTVFVMYLLATLRLDWAAIAKHAVELAAEAMPLLGRAGDPGLEDDSHDTPAEAELTVIAT